MKINGAPTGLWSRGARTHFDGMKATLDLVSLYLELG